VPKIINVDRNEGYTFPNWARKLYRRDLVASGPVSYDLERVRIVTTDDLGATNQKERTGRQLLEQAEGLGLLEKNLTVKDARALSKITPWDNIPHHLRSGRPMVLWSSAAEGHDGRISVPIVILVSKMTLDWHFLDRIFARSFYTPLYPEE
jgi:hypothetical protein